MSRLYDKDGVDGPWLKAMKEPIPVPPAPPAPPASEPIPKETATDEVDGDVFENIRIGNLTRYAATMLRRLAPEDARLLDKISDRCLERAREAVKA